jgi:hypothetical protein
MFRTKYTLSEVARMLKRSLAFMVREVESGRLGAALESVRRRGGGNRSYLISVGNLKRYLGPKMSHQLLGTGAPEKRPEEVIDERAPVYGSAKRCNTCGRIRSVREFMKDSLYPDNYYPTCRDCMSKDAKRWKGGR